MPGVYDKDDPRFSRRIVGTVQERVIEAEASAGFPKVGLARYREFTALRDMQAKVVAKAGIGGAAVSRDLGFGCQNGEKDSAQGIAAMVQPVEHSHGVGEQAGHLRLQIAVEEPDRSPLTCNPAGHP